MASDDELQRIVADTSRVLTTLRLRLYEASNNDDEAAIKWFQKRIVSIERDAQKRDALTGAGLE